MRSASASVICEPWVTVVQPASAAARTAEAAWACTQTRLPSAFASLQGDYGSAPLVIAVGQAVDGDQFITRLAGTDGVARINYGRSDKLNGGAAPKTSAKDAAAFAYAVLENRWKATRAPLEPIEPGRYEKEMPPQGAPQGETGRLVTAVVEFAGLMQWQDILARLTHVPGIRTLDVNSLSARTARSMWASRSSRLRLTCGRRRTARTMPS